MPPAAVHASLLPQGPGSPPLPSPLALLGAWRGRKPWLAFAQLGAVWLSVNAVWGLTSPDDTLVSGLLRSAGPLWVWPVVVGAGLTATCARSVWAGNKPSAALTGMLAAYLIGVAVSRVAVGGLALPGLRGPAEVLGWAVRRSFLLVPAIPMLLVYLWLDRRPAHYPFRFGEWTPVTRLLSSGDTERTWSRQFGVWLLLAIAPLALLMQAAVGFSPVSNGTLWPYLMPLAGLALLNASAEEVLFRGLLQPVLVQRLGAPGGIAVGAVFFGMHHFGSSPSPLAALPTLLITAWLGLVWGKSVHETRGLGWAVLTHASIDLAFFSAFFVPKPGG